MPRISCSPGVTFALILSTVFLFTTGGCASAPYPAAGGDGLPSTQVDWPSLELAQSWNGERFVVPIQPVVIPAESLTPGLRGWHIHKWSDWRVTLPDGRRAIVWTGRDARTGGTMDRVTVYRADASLAQEQWNYDGRPNAPGRWITYDADGRTPSIEVQAARGCVSDVIFYEHGRKTRHLMASDTGRINLDYRFASDGTETIANAVPVRVEPE